MTLDTVVEVASSDAVQDFAGLSCANSQGCRAMR
jgi:hypothetical protein